MKTIINDIEMLDSSNFKKLIIKLQNDKFKITVVGQESNYKTIPNKIGFFQTIKNLNSDEKVIEIIKYYLRNHTINSINNSVDLYNHSGKYCISYSTNSFMAIDMKFPARLNHILIGDLINEKYQHDRLNFLEENKEYNEIMIKLSTGMISSYKINECGCIELNVVAKYEDSFIENFVRLKLDEYSKHAYIRPNFKYNETLNQYVYLGDKIVCDDLSIGFDEEYKKMFEQIIKDHNNQIEIEKKLQLKMEGF
ncbi:MAG: hypothetical protein PUD59_00195 [bacterium]|nr:hypothetical protein [bacterium]